MWEDRYPWDESKRVRDIELSQPAGTKTKLGHKRGASATADVLAGKWSLIPKRPLTVTPAHPKFNRTEKLVKESMNGNLLVTGWEMNPLRHATSDPGCQQ